MFSTRPEINKKENPKFLERYSNLKTPKSYDSFEKEIKSVFLSDNEKIEGLNFTFINPISQGSYHAASMFHQFQLISDGMTPSEYSTTVQFRTNKSMGYCRIDTHSWVVQSAMEYKFLDQKLNFTLNHNNYNHAVAGSLGYKGPTYRLSGNFGGAKDEFGASYTQSITPKISGGLRFKFENTSGESKLATAFRYNKSEDLVLLGEFKLEPNGLNNKKILKLGYYEKALIDVQMAAQFTYNLSETTSSFKYGVHKKFLNGNALKVMVDQDTNVSVSFEQEIGEKIALHTICDWDPEKSSLKYGIGVQVVAGN